MPWLRPGKLVDGQNHIRDPIDQGRYGNPVEIGVVPGRLRSERLKCARQSGNQQTGQCPIHAVREFLSLGKLQNGDDDEGRGERGHDHVAQPVRQMKDPVVERHVSEVHSLSYIIEISSLQIAETVSRASATTTSRRNGFLVAKFKIAPTSARTAAIGMTVPTRWFHTLSSTSTVAYCVPVL